VTRRGAECGGQAPEQATGTGAGLDVAPFVATRYADPQRLAAYTAPAYDLIEPAERARLTSADPRSIVHLTLPTFGAEDAAARLAAWRADGTLAVERFAALYVYDLAGPGAQRSTRGWMGAVALAPPPVVAPHEATVGAVVADRRALRAATDADLEPVVFAHDGPPGPAAALASRIVAERAPHADLTDDAGVRHRLWRVADPAEVATVRADLARRRAVIADGHHRWAAASPPPAPPAADAPALAPPAADAPALAPPAADAPALAPPPSAGVVSAASPPAGPNAVPAPPGLPNAGSATAPIAVPAAASPAADGPLADPPAADAPAGASPVADASAAPAPPAAARGVAGRVLALVVPAGEHGPRVQAIHRVLPHTTLDRLDSRRFRSAAIAPLVADAAEELLATTAIPLVLATDGIRWLRLTEPDTAGVTPAAWRGLGVALVDALLVGERSVVLRHSIAAAVDEARGTGGVALLVPATPTATVLELAARGVLMPRKSTFFVPKPRTGLVLRCFADQPAEPS
jgi:hypothetical protein